MIDAGNGCPMYRNAFLTLGKHESGRKVGGGGKSGWKMKIEAPEAPRFAVRRTGVLAG
jgi:hypothetical protein